VYVANPPALAPRVLLPGAAAFTITPTQTTSVLGNGYKYLITHVLNYYNELQVDIAPGLWSRPEVRQFWITLPP